MTPRARALLALCLALTAPAAAAFDCRDGLRVVSFPGRLTLSAGEDETVLSSGSLAYALPSDASLRVVQGEALMLVDGVRVSADDGDLLTFFCSGGAAELQVHEGAVEIKSSEGVSRSISAGEFIVLPPLAFPAPAVPELKSTPPRQALITLLPMKFLLETHPYYQFLQSYQSNIYRVPPDRPDGQRVGGGVLGSWITLHNPGLASRVLFSRSSWLDLTYDLKARRYSKQSEANNDLEHGFYFALNRQARTAKIKLWDTYLNTTNPPTSELTGREKRFQNTLGGDAEVIYGRKNILGLGVQHTMHKFLNPSLGAQLNRYEQSGAIRVGQMIQPRTRLYLQYARQIIHYSSGRPDNSKGHLFDAVLDGEITPKLSAVLKAGLQSRSYDSDDSSSRQFRLDLQGTYKPGPKTQMSLSAFRSVEEARFAGTRFYTSTGFGAGITRILLKLTAGLNLRYQRDAYSDQSTIDGVTAARRDSYYILGANLGYPILPWLSAAASQTWTRRQSVFPGEFGYKDSQTAFGFRAQF